MATTRLFDQPSLEDWSSEEGFSRIFNTYWKRLYIMAYRRLNDEELAKDIIQDLFASIWLRRNDMVVNGPVEGYLRNALQYQLIAHFRKENVRSKAFAHLLDRMAGVEENIRDILTEQDLERTIHAELEQMPDTMREIFSLRIRDYTVVEIANSLNLAEKTVRNNISKGLSRIRKAISKDFPEDFSVICIALFVVVLT